ncbi:MAG: Uma2 family endonuclease [Rubrobacteraceae bacterium]|nr:Uma2 family endonuclease [Rubrobacter sp.]
MENFSTSGLMSVEEYLELERDSEVRHEYVNGVLYAMTGAGRRHNSIANNISSLLWIAARGGPCRVYQSDMKVLTPDGPFYYPDVMVACGDEPEDEYFEDAPCLLVEVVSPKTESKDRLEKLAAYRKIPTLGAYLIVDQKQRRIERHFRDENGKWNRTELTDGEGRLPAPCPPGAELSLADIYEGL